jgi:hypothetical protein
MIDIIYTGQKGFYHITEKNHQLLFDKIKEISDIKIHWFTKPNQFRGVCPYDNTEARGSIQVWDLVDALKSTENNIFIKLRSDIWFTKESIDIIVKELSLILQSSQELSFIGWMYKDWDFNQPYSKISVVGEDRIQDFVIIGNKNKLADADTIFSRLNSRRPGKNISGNKTFKDIIDDATKAFTIKTHMYLCRKEYKKIKESQLAIDYLDMYAKGKAAEYKNWYVNHRKLK